jgi:hypothetical protein
MSTEKNYTMYGVMDDVGWRTIILLNTRDFLGLHYCTPKNFLRTLIEEQR